MCGILGAFSQETIKGGKFKEALNHLSSRGPDDERYLDLETGTYYRGVDSKIFKTKDVSELSSTKILGNRRLAVTGGSKCRLPLTYKNLTLAYEGEIYNWRDIRDKLRERGHEFKTEGDAEVFLHAFHEWRLEAFKKIEGKWAAAIYNENSGKLYCFRDHFGTKPLYYLQGDGEFFFSSMISPLLELKNKPPEEHSQTSIAYLKNGTVDHTRNTFFKEIKQLRPAEYLVYDEQRVAVKQLPESEKSSSSQSLNEIISRNLKLKIPEVDWCTTLSGGLDSSIIACELSDEIPVSYALDIEDGYYESSKYRLSISSKEDLEIKEIEVSIEDLIENIDKSITEQEEPTNMLPAQAQNILFKEISNEGRKVVLTGSGADELFLGYGKFMPVAVKDSLSREGPLNAFKLLLRHRRNLNYSNTLYLISLFTKTQPKEWLKQKLGLGNTLLNIPDDYNNSYSRKPANLCEARENHLEYNWYPAIMRFTDKNAGAHGLETREGFLSQELLQHVKSQNPVENFRNGETKKTLRDAFQDVLPEKILERDDKVGFLPTNNKAAKSEVKRMLEEVFRSESFGSEEFINQEKVIKSLQKGNLDFEMAYRLYCYEVWKREFIKSNRFQ